MKIHASSTIALVMALALTSTAAAQTNPPMNGPSDSASTVPTPATYNNRTGTPPGTYNYSTTSGTSTSSGRSSGSLPRTASPMPLFSLLGSAATAAGFWLSQFRRRR